MAAKTPTPPVVEKQELAVPEPKPETPWSRVWQFVLRWQESITWMPLVVIIAISTWIVLGSLDRSAAIDVLPILVMLPVKVLYVLMALAGTYLVRRRWRLRLTPEQQTNYWTSLNAGQRGTMLVFITDAIFTLCAFFALLYYFRLPS